MNEINSIEVVIVPEVPNVIDTQQIHVYIPVGSNNVPGVNTYDSNDFEIINGKVYLKDIQKVISTKNTDTIELKKEGNTLSANLINSEKYLQAKRQDFTEEEQAIIRGNLNVGSNEGGTDIVVAGKHVSSVVFDEDPQEQLDKKVEFEETDGANFVMDSARISNPNLLINGDFKINQRGQTSYLTTGAAIYSIDRYVLSHNLKLDVNNDHSITLTNNNGSAGRHIIQFFEDWKEMKGKTYTITVKFRNAPVGYKYRIGFYDGRDVIYSDDTYKSSNGVIVKTLTIKETFGDYHEKIGFIYYPLNGTSSAPAVGSNITLDYFKVELGSVTTVFSSRPYAEELVLCQRYYIKYTATSNRSIFMNGILNSTSECYFTIDRTFRTYPTVVMNGAFIFYGASYKTITGMSCIKDYNTNNSITIWCAFAQDTSLTINVPVRLRADSDDASLELDAEIH